MSSEDPKNRSEPPEQDEPKTHHLPPDDHEPTIIIPQGSELEEGDESGYSVRPREQQAPPPTETDGAPVEDGGEGGGEDFVVLLPEERTDAAPPPTDSLDHSEMGQTSVESMPPDVTEEWNPLETMSLSAKEEAPGSATEAAPLTEFLDSDDPFVTQTVPADEPASDEGPNTEQIRLLSEHPAYLGESQSGDETATLEGIAFGEDLEGLPDLENVEDITALLEEIDSDHLAAPAESFELPLEEAAEPAKSRVSLLLPLAAAAALVVTAVLYGPALYERLSSVGEESVASASAASRTADREPAPAADTDTDPEGEVETGGPEAVVTDSDPVPGGVSDTDPLPAPDPEPHSADPLKDWLALALADNLGVAAATEDKR